MLFQIIRNIQNRPLPERRRLAFWIALLLTVVVAFLWVVTLLLADAPPAVTDATPGPFGALYENLSEGFTAAKDAIKK